MAELNDMCLESGTKHERDTKENQTLRLKVESMKAKRNELEAWTIVNSRLTVPSTKTVMDCIDQAQLPSRYDPLVLPRVRSGFDKMPLHNTCRLHRCKISQCLVAKKDCPVPYINAGTEVNLCPPRPEATTYECTDKILIQSGSPMGIGFGVTWVIIGALLGIAGIAMLASGGGDSDNKAPMSAPKELYPSD